MKTQAKKMILAAATIALVAGASQHADAGCGGGGHRGGISFGFGGGHRGVQVSLGGSSHHRHASYAPVQHRAPVYNTTPVYNPTPVYSPAPVFQNAPLSYSAPIQQSVASLPQPVSSTPVVDQTTNQSVARPVAPVAPVAPTTSPQPTETTEASALAVLASINDSNANATSNQIPEFGAATAATPQSGNAPTHVGTWTVALPGNQSVKLELTANGNFAWTATKDGKSSNFTGQYRLESGRLVLVRSSDLQKMEGDWTGAANGFTFKVDGETSGGLNFSRS